MQKQAKTFDVLVLAPMSTGKTTLINALIGRDLLHTANEAVTACITSVKHSRSARYFKAVCYSHDSVEIGRQKNPTPAQLRAWNADQQIKRIQISGNFRSTPRHVTGLVLHDTPGPNNSVDNRHAELMLEALRTISFNALCYVLDVGYIGTRDDCELLELIQDQLSRSSQHQVIFVLNKVDRLDPDKGEDLANYVRSAKAYLEGLGFEHPLIVPTIADVTLYARKALNSEFLTRAQQTRLSQALIDFKETRSSLVDAAHMSEDHRRHIHQRLKRLHATWQSRLSSSQSSEDADLHQLIAYSGVWTVEALIKHQHLELARS